jgi:hypothetical protein
MISQKGAVGVVDGVREKRSSRRRVGEEGRSVKCLLVWAWGLGLGIMMRGV